MLISHEQLQEINKVQVEILRAVTEVCERLNLKFYMVHGSLLGTIRDHKFVPDDDDIDIAFFRNDYEIFMREAPKYLDGHYFVQTCESDSGYPLGFGKIRDSRTTYIIEEARHLPMNHGIYIDVFPIDNCKKGGIGAKLYNLRYKLLNMRIATVYDLSGESTVKKLVRGVAKLIYPSQVRAIRLRESLLKSCPESGFVRMSGGKAAEQLMPMAWFSDAIEDEFEGVPVFIPGKYEDYLTLIYGDYRNRTLVEDKISNSESIEINACVVDTDRPYTQYDQTFKG